MTNEERHHDEVIIAHERIAYERGVADGYAEALEEMKDKERPQGEWIKNETRPNECQCIYCGNYDLSYFPYCHWCGADMRGTRK